MSWAYLLFRVTDQLIEDKGKTNNVYGFIRPVLNAVQSAAILEVRSSSILPSRLNMF